MFLNIDSFYLIDNQRVQNSDFRLMNLSLRLHNIFLLYF